MSHKLAQELRESAKATFYDPLKSELNRAADCIDELTAALREIASVSKVIAQSEDMAQALTTLLSSNRKIALTALEGTCSD